MRHFRLPICFLLITTSQINCADPSDSTLRQTDTASTDSSSGGGTDEADVGYADSSVGPDSSFNRPSEDVGAEVSEDGVTLDRSGLEAPDLGSETSSGGSDGGTMASDASQETDNDAAAHDAGAQPDLVSDVGQDATTADVLTGPDRPVIDFGADDTGSDDDGPITTIRDRDRDGVTDIADNCPGTSNPRQTDSDDDGVGNECDNCSASYNPDQRDYNGDELGDQCDPLIPTPCTDANDPYPRGDDASDCRGSLGLPGGMKMYYYRNHALNPGDAGSYPWVHRAVIVQHGSGRTAYSYFDRMIQASEYAGADRNTLVIAPHFQTSEDLTSCGDDGECRSPIPADRAYWTSGGWKQGDMSRSLSPISSFEVYDRIILERLANRDWYPNLEEIVITGHSAGGQFTQRYAVGTEVDFEDDVDHLDFRFIVANPSSYVYLGTNRWDQSSGTPVCQPGDFPDYAFEIPSGSACQSTYNDYRYGRDGIALGHYMRRTTRDEWRANFPERHVVYMMGDEDLDQTYEPTKVDDSCQARWQGYCRWDRGRIFFAYMERFYQPHNHSFVTVHGVGHSGSSMYRSPEGVLTVFGVPKN